MIKLIAMDLDGTLFNSDHKSVSDRNVNALRSASEKGIKIVIASGRTYCQITNVLKRVGVIDYVIVSNGASSIDNMGNVISSDCMGYEEWKGIYNILEENDIVTEVYNSGNTYLKRSAIKRYKNSDLSEDLLDELRAVINLCDNVTETLKGEKAEKLTSIYVPSDKFLYLKNLFEERNMTVTSSIPGNMEINKTGINKGSGLKRLCDTLNIKSDEVMVFGDGGNDIEMLRWAGCSFAMENAIEEAKAAARYIADSNFNDGVAKEIEKIVL